jgi:hypothetical protein
LKTGEKFMVVPSIYWPVEFLEIELAAKLVSYWNSFRP